MASGVIYALAGGFASGIFVRSFFVLDLVMFAAIGAAAVCAFIASRGRGGRAAFLGALALAGFVLGAWRMDLASRVPDEGAVPHFVGERVTIVGDIVREPDPRNVRTLLTIRARLVEGEAADALVLVSADRYPAFRYGDTVSVEGELALPEAFEGEFGRTFDYPGYLAARGVRYQVSFAEVSLLAQGGGNAIMHTLYGTKAAFMRSIESVLPEPHAGLAEGLTLGVKRALGDDLERAFRTTGLIHIVVLSGYNITLIAEAVMRLLSFFFALRARVVFGVVAIAAFALAVGLSATVARASLMAIFVLIARATGRTYEVVRALTIAAVVMLLINPSLLIYDPGFQLSFLATLGLVLVGPLIERWLGLVPTRFQVREFVTATISTQIMVLPILLYSIGELSLVAVPVNVLALMAVPAAMLFTFLGAVAGFVSTTLGMLAAYPAYLLLAYIIGVVEFFASLPLASVIVPPFPFWVVLWSYALIAVWLWWMLKEDSTKPPTENAPEAQPPARDPLPFR